MIKNKKMKKIKNTFISTYTFIYNGIHTNNSGPVLPLTNFFKVKSENLYLLEQPLPGSDFVDIILTLFSKSKIKTIIKRNFIIRKNKKIEPNMTYISFKIRDILSNFYFFSKYLKKFKKRKIDLFIGLECVNAICGIILRKLGLVDKVVYYIFDWAPDRYKNKIINYLYIFLDKIATYYSDFTWNITYAINEAKVDMLNFKSEKMSPQVYVPYSVEFKKRYVLEYNEINKNLLIYSGGLIEENGPLLLLEAYKNVRVKHPETKLLIIGGGGLQKDMEKYIIRNNMNKNVEITGFISSEEEIIKLQCKGAIGIAPYPKIKGSRKLFGDVIKIRMYFACGLVTVTTPIPPVSKEIKNEKLGISTKNDSYNEIANAICILLENEKKLFKYRKNVINKAKTMSWENTYQLALNKMGFLNNKNINKN